MSAPIPRLAEGDVTLITAYIKANIDAALAGVRAQWADALVTTESPQSYFIYRKAQGYKLPAVFVIHDEMDFRIADMKANFINGKSTIAVSVLVEDKDEFLLTKKAFRYQQALHYVLDQAQMVSNAGGLKLICVVYRHTFSPHWTTGEDNSEDGVNFRKEVVLECQVEHLENY
jgi:hypothetical protein